MTSPPTRNPSTLAPPPPGDPPCPKTATAAPGTARSARTGTRQARLISRRLRRHRLLTHRATHRHTTGTPTARDYHRVGGCTTSLHLVYN